LLFNFIATLVVFMRLRSPPADCLNRNYCCRIKQFDGSQKIAY